MAKKRHLPSASDDIFGVPRKRTVKNPLNFDFPSLYPSQTRKDSRRAFTKTQQKQILSQQDHKCARCHKKLDIAIHFHHAKPWSSGGRTIVQNGRALCANCHEIISHKDRLKRVDKKRKPRNTNPFL